MFDIIVTLLKKIFQDICMIIRIDSSVSPNSCMIAQDTHWYIKLGDFAFDMSANPLSWVDISLPASNKSSNRSRLSTPIFLHVILVVVVVIPAQSRHSLGEVAIQLDLEVVLSVPSEIDTVRCQFHAPLVCWKSVYLQGFCFVCGPEQKFWIHYQVEISDGKKAAEPDHSHCRSWLWSINYSIAISEQNLNIVWRSFEHDLTLIQTRFAFKKIWINLIARLAALCC